MSRIAKAPIQIPTGVDFTQQGQALTIKGKNGQLKMNVHPSVELVNDDGVLQLKARNATKSADALAGTMRQLVNNMIIGVTQGFERKLQLNGVGYRVKATGNTLNLTLGYSHPVDYELPEGVTAETPTQTEIVLKGANKQLVGQVASEVRAFRPPEPYKGKGVRYAEEHVRRKETKKK